MYSALGEVALESAKPGTATVAPSAPIAGDAQISARRRELPMIELQGIRLHSLTERQTIDHIVDELSKGRGGVVITPNVDHVRRCQRDLHFSALVGEASLIVADGMPLVWASRLQGTPLPQRVAGSDLISSLSAAAAAGNRSIYLLGGTTGTADAAARILQDRHPTLRIAGTDCPAPGFEKNEAELRQIVRRLNEARPDIIYVALGSPKQEMLIDRLSRQLPPAWWLGVGVSFSFLTGDVRRAPVWMQRWGLEWFHRLAQEPRRLFKRYLVVGLPFAGIMLARAAGRGLAVMLGLAEKPVSTDPARTISGSYKSNFQSATADSHDTSAAVSSTAPAVSSDAAPASFPHTSASPRHEVVSLQRLKALVLLGGSVRPRPLTVATGRSPLDLPLAPGRTILHHWMSNSAELARQAGLERLPVRLLLDRETRAPENFSGMQRELFSVERDLAAYRGSGGILGNLAHEFEDDDLILVANAAEVLLEPLAALAIALSQTGGVVSLISHLDDTPSGLMLVACKALRLIPTVGFVDMKEQALRAIALRHDVRVAPFARATGIAVRTLADYVRTLRLLSGRGDADLAAPEGLAENWRPAFSLSEVGATVDPTARVHDSVVLGGGVVEAGGVVVRSVVCPGGIVARDRSAVDQLVTGKGHRRQDKQ